MRGVLELVGGLAARVAGPWLFVALTIGSAAAGGFVGWQAARALSAAEVAAAERDRAAAELRLEGFRRELAEATAGAERRAAERQREAFAALRAREAAIARELEALPAEVSMVIAPRLAELRRAADAPDLDCLRRPLPAAALDGLRRPAGGPAAPDDRRGTGPR